MCVNGLNTCMLTCTDYLTSTDLNQSIIIIIIILNKVH